MDLREPGLFRVEVGGRVLLGPLTCRRTFRSGEHADSLKVEGGCLRQDLLRVEGGRRRDHGRPRGREFLEMHAGRLPPQLL
ncbi:hypothetical protein ABGB12_26265 [Actinocorallia sp. B10E7]|uniref:hypothetical protein n=1 Tax=Actinocorallia sp. B10E7 TaxID=3153558 RepID=UPI00325ED5CD